MAAGKFFLENTLGHLTEDHRLAFLKRCVTVVVGNNAVYVRPPSADKATTAYKFTDNDVRKDLLMHLGNKNFFGLWKKTRC